MHETAILRPSQPSYRSAIDGGWQLLKTQYKSLFVTIILFLILLGLGVVADNLLNILSPKYTDLWRVPMYLWFYLISIGFYRVLAKKLTGQSGVLGDLFWGLKQSEAWTLALIPAALATLVLLFSGLNVSNGQPIPPELFLQPRFWFGLLLSSLIGTFFGYVFMLYAAYGATSKTALSNSLRIFGSKWPWLLFPYVITLFGMLIVLFFGIIVGLVIGLLAFLTKLLHVMVIGKIIFSVLLVVFLLVVMIAFLIWMYGSMLTATGALAETSTRDHY
jgi:hypothetical protein